MNSKNYEYDKERDLQLTKDSGNFETNSRLTYFLFLLLRDGLPAGEVEKFLQESKNDGEIVRLSNGFIAQYASNIAKELVKN